MDEFELIRRFFDRQVSASGVVVGIGDDGAVLRPDSGRDEVQVIDTLVEGVHFPVGLDAADIAYRVVAVNLSDIAAMGARPRWMTLALTMPAKDEHWLAAFSTGLFEAAAAFDVALVGGDTTRGDTVVATVHITGDVAPGEAVLRSGAKPGDSIFVSGTIGDAAAGLDLLQRGEHDPYLVRRFLRPSARVALGLRLPGRASAAIDVSDGLLADLTKLLQASGAGGELLLERLPISEALKARFDEPRRTELVLAGGDDYELCFTATPASVVDLPDVTEIGRVTPGDGVVCQRDGKVVEYQNHGYRHFQ